MTGVDALIERGIANPERLYVTGGSGGGVLTGESDYRTPIGETEQFYLALKLRKVDTAMVRVPEASHGIAGRPSNLIAKVVNILGWFELHKD